MFRISKVLNHNAVLAVSAEDNTEYLIMGKGLGFGKKVSERIETTENDRIYTLAQQTGRGAAKELAKTISPEYLEITNELLDSAEEVFGKLDRNILFPLADHIEFAVKRIYQHEEISNPLTGDIRVLFHMEYKAAEKLSEILKNRMDITIHEDEIGYVALHIHSAACDSNVSEAMQTAAAVRKCITFLEESMGRSISVMSLSYNRMMNHIRYMVFRTLKGEHLKLNMNDYMAIRYPESYEIARQVCEQLGKELHHELEEVEIGYLAMHIERICESEYDS